MILKEFLQIIIYRIINKCFKDISLSLSLSVKVMP